MSMSTTGGTGVAQHRNLVTEIPGPVSQRKFARKKQYVADGVGTTLPAYARASA